MDQITLSISRGEWFGLVGPDGAGKTTFLRILAGLLSISDGEVIINDINLGKDPEANKTKIGYMAQEFSLYDKLTVIENLKFNTETKVLELKDRLEDAEDALEATYLQVEISEIETNQKQVEYVDTYVSNIASAKRQVKEIKQTIEKEEEFLIKQVEELESKIASRQEIIAKLK